MPKTIHEFIKSYAAVWGIEETESLIERGYTPVLVSDGESVKWVWRLTQPDSCATLESGRFYSRLSGSAD